MTLELRKTSTVEPASPTVRQRARQTLIAQRRVVVARSRRGAATAWLVARQVPGLVWRLPGWAIRGAGRATAMWWRWVRDVDGADLRAHHAGARETPDYLRASQAHAEHLRVRWGGSIAVALIALVAVLAWLAPSGLAAMTGAATLVTLVRVLPRRGWGELLGAGLAAVLVYLATPALIGWLGERIPAPPGWAWWATGVGAVIVLGWIGRPEEKPLVTLPTTLLAPAAAPRLTAPMATAALLTLGHPKMREADDIRLLADPHERGPGVQIGLELPPGVPATYVMDKREELAAALRRELGTVWPSVGSRHPGHLVLYVADQPMHLALQAPWPLMDDGQVDLFEPVAVATDQTGQWVKITLAYASGVIGAVPRQGKTFLLRELLLIAGLDPRAKVYAFDGKGTGDLSPCALFAEYVGVGDEPEDIAEQLEVMRGLRAELRRRARVIRTLPREECPESKVTSVLASRRDLGLEPIVVGVDETQTWFEYGVKGNKEHKAIREELAAICTDLAKRGPALGFICLLATQQVNANTIPTSISNNAVIRFCLKVFGHVANDQILGTGARKEGIDATMFSPADKGIGYLRADGADARIVRTVVGLDAVAAERVAQRARQLRAAAGRLADPDVLDAVVVVDLVEDALRVLEERGREKAQHVELVEWLAELRPEHADLDVEALSARLRSAGVPVVQVRSGDTNRRGVRAADLREQREEERP